MRCKPRPHFGFIKYTKPKPRVIWGSMIEIAETIGGNRRNLYLAWNGKRNGYLGYFPIKTEEDIDKYYKPPRPPKSLKERLEVKKHNKEVWSQWKLVMYKNWSRGEPAPTESYRKIIGTPCQIRKHIGIGVANLNVMIRSYKGTLTSSFSPVWTYKGWRIFSIHTENTVTIPQVKISMSEKTRHIRQEYRRLRSEEYLRHNNKEKV